MTVAVGLSPRWDSGKSQVAERRLKASRNQVLASTVAPRRKNLMDLNRGLKPTATITSSLREEGQRRLAVKRVIGWSQSTKLQTPSTRKAPRTKPQKSPERCEKVQGRSLWAPATGLSGRFGASSLEVRWCLELGFGAYNSAINRSAENSEESSGFSPEWRSCLSSQVIVFLCVLCVLCG